MTGPADGAGAGDPDEPAADDVDHLDDAAAVDEALPDSVSLDELADQVAGIADQLEENDALVRTAVLGMARDSDALKATVGQLAARVAEFAPPVEDETPEPPPTAWVDYAGAQDWQALAGWVDWLVCTYDLQPSRTVLPCWPAHRGVAEELAALRTAWVMAAKAGRAKTPNDAMIYWHDRWLHPCLPRLRDAFQYGTCADKHKAPRPGRTADLDLLAAALMAAAERAAASTGLDGPPVDPITGELL